MTVTQTTVGKTETDLEVHANSALLIALPWLDVAAIQHQLTFSFKLGHKTVEINGAKASSLRGRLDMLIESAGKRLAILELKKPGQPLDADDVDQGLSYARVLHPRPPIVIVSNETETRTHATETGDLLKDACREDGIIEPVTFSLLRFLEREQDNADEWLEEVCDDGSASLLNRLSQALLMLAVLNPKASRAEWAKTRLDTLVNPALKKAFHRPRASA